MEWSAASVELGKKLIKGMSVKKMEAFCDSMHTKEANGQKLTKTEELKWMAITEAFTRK